MLVLFISCACLLQKHMHRYNSHYYNLAIITNNANSNSNSNSNSIDNRVNQYVHRLKSTSPLFASTDKRNRKNYASESKTDSIRQSRVARSIRDELTDIICNVDIKANAYPDEDLLKATSIVDVEISPDLSYAKVYITVLGNAVAKRQVFVWLCENIGQVRYSLAKRMRHMRRCPEIFIKLADTQANGHLMSVMEEISSTKVGDDDVEYESFEENDE